MSVCCECCVLSGRGLCDELITRPDESYRLWCVAVCVIETSSARSQTSVNSIKNTFYCSHWYMLFIVKVKVKVTLEQATKAQRGSRDIALLFL
jgi:hypothetical protein